MLGNYWPSHEIVTESLEYSHMSYLIVFGQLACNIATYA